MAQADYVTNANRTQIVDAGATSANAVQAAHGKLLTSLSRCPPQGLPVDTKHTDLEARSDHIRVVLAALSAYLIAVLEDTAENVPGGLDLRQIDALFSDLTSEVTGTLQKVADDLDGWYQ